MLGLDDRPNRQMIFLLSPFRPEYLPTGKAGRLPLGKPTLAERHSVSTRDPAGALVIAHRARHSVPRRMGLAGASATMGVASGDVPSGQTWRMTEQ